MDFDKYSLFNMIKEYNKNKPIIDAYFQGKSIENYSRSGDGLNDDQKTILGFSIGVFAVVLLVNIIIYIFSIILLIKNWNNLTELARVFATVCLFLGLPLISLIIILSTKSN